MATLTAASTDDMPALVGDNGESAAEAAFRDGGICGAPALPPPLSLLLLLFL